MRHEDLISTREAARRMECTQQTICLWIRLGLHGEKLEARKVGKRWFTTADALDAFVNKAFDRRTEVVESEGLREDAARFGLTC